MATALITGASTGIGYELAKVFAKNNYNLVLVARSQDKLQDLAKDIQSHNSNIHIHILPFDLNQKNSPREIYEKLQKQNIRIDVLVNNAGLGEHGAFEKTDWAREEEMINVNITALVHLTKLFVPEMIKNKSGHILNVASVAGFQPGPFMAVYYATKAFVLSFSEALSEELNGSGVYVTALCPGPTKSNFSKAAKMGKTKLFSRSGIPSSQEVAEFGFKAMNCNKTVAVHGLGNKMLVQSLRVAPRSLVRKIVRSLQA